MKWQLVVLALLFFMPLNAEVKIFLHSKVECDGSAIKLGDISTIRGVSAQKTSIADATISQTIINDGYVDRNEIFMILKDIECDYKLYGNSVRIVPVKKSKRIKIKTPDTIERGDSVDIKILRNGVIIETTGKSMVLANPGDKVTIKLKGGRELKGILKEKRIVEVGS